MEPHLLASLIERAKRRESSPVSWNRSWTRSSCRNPDRGVTGGHTDHATNDPDDSGGGVATGTWLAGLVVFAFAHG